MGVSTDAKLVYGIAWTDDDDEEHFGEYKIDDDAHTAIDQRLDPLGLELDIHCSYSSPMYALVVKITKLVANRGFPERVKLKRDTILELEWNGLLAQGRTILLDAFPAAEFFKKQTPGWWLYSLWG